MKNDKTRDTPSDERPARGPGEHTMNEHEYTLRRVLYLIVCGTGYAATIHEFVEQAKIRGWVPQSL